MLLAIMIMAKCNAWLLLAYGLYPPPPTPPAFVQTQPPIDMKYEVGHKIILN